MLRTAEKFRGRERDRIYMEETNRAKIQWDMSDLVKVNLKRAGIYVMLGKSKLFN